MELEKSLLEFITQIVNSRDTLTEGNYVSSDDKYKLTIYEMFPDSVINNVTYRAPAGCIVRSNITTGEVQLKLDVLKLSGVSATFWLVWGFIRNGCSNATDADAKALPITLAMYPNIKRSDLAQFYQEFNQQLSLTLSDANVLRSEVFFELVSDQLVSGLSDSSIKAE